MITPNQVSELTQRSTEAIERILAAVPELYSRCKLDARDGYPSASMRDGSGGGNSDGPSHGDPVGELAVADPLRDPRRYDYRKVCEYVMKATAFLAAADGIVRHLGEIHPQETKAREVGMCEACGRTVARTAADPLVSGYDRTCYQAWRRAGYPDRFAFNASRQQAEAV